MIFFYVNDIHFFMYKHKQKVIVNHKGNIASPIVNTLKICNFKLVMFNNFIAKQPLNSIETGYQKFIFKILNIYK